METIERVSREGRDSSWTPGPFRVEIQPDRHRVYVAPRGELDLATTTRVAEKIDALVARGLDAIVMDGPHAVSRVFELVGLRYVLAFEDSQ